MKWLVSQKKFLEHDFDLPIEGRYGAYLLYKDPEYGFTINAVVIPADCHMPAHDHGEGWQVHGGYIGSLRLTHYERMDAGTLPGRFELRSLDTVDIASGEVETLPPFFIHKVSNITGQPAVAITVHRHDLSQFWRSEYDLEAGEVRRARYDPAEHPPRLPPELDSNQAPCSAPGPGLR